MKKIICIIEWLHPLSAASQENGLGNWLIYIGSKQLNSKWNYTTKFSTEITIPWAISSNKLIRTGLGYDIGSKSNILLDMGISTPRILLKMPTIKPR